MVGKGETKNPQKVKPKNKAPKFNWKVILVMVLVVAALSSGLYYWNDWRSSSSDTTTATESGDAQESDRVIASLNQVLLPSSDQAPTVARIEDPVVLQNTNPQFYKDAQAGDYLLLYPNRAVIYRESDNLIINVAPAPIINTNDIAPTN